MQRRKRLVILGPAEGLHLFKWIRPFVDSYEVTALTFHNNEVPPDILGKFTYKKLPRLTGTKFDFLINIFRIAYEFAKIKPDLIHAHYASSYGFIVVLASKLLPYLKAKKCITIWGSDFLLTIKRPFGGCFLRFVLGNYNWINSPNEYIKSKIVELDIQVSVDVFQYGVKVEGFDRSVNEEIESKYKDLQTIKIISNRGWSPIYNIENVIEGFKMALLKKPNLRLIVSNGGSTSESETVHALCAGTPEIRIIGWTSREELVRELSQAHIVLSVPLSDGMPLSVLEAVYFGCFPLLSDLPANREILENCDGQIVGFSASEIAEGIIRSVSEVGVFSYLHNQEVIKEKYSYERNMERLRFVYDRLLFSER
ncbi:MAG: glycosyltransferase [Bdellovibrio sp.]